MRPATLWFTLWCMLVVLLFALASWRGWSPFADGPRGGGGGGGYTAGGPRHK